MILKMLGAVTGIALIGRGLYNLCLTKEEKTKRFFAKLDREREAEERHNEWAQWEKRNEQSGH